MKLSYDQAFPFHQTVPGKRLILMKWMQISADLANKYANMCLGNWNLCYCTYKIKYLVLGEAIDCASQN